MDWKSNAGDCEVPFRLIYKEVETEQYTVDWCKINGIRVHNDSVTADLSIPKTSSAQDSQRKAESRHDLAR